MPFLAPQKTAETALLGAWDLAICLSLFLQGVLCAQFTHYAAVSTNKRDSIWLKLFVAGLAFMTMLKSLQAVALMWIQNVLLFGNLEAASNLWDTHWVSKITLILEATMAFCVQMYFCRRLWASPLISQAALSRNAFVVITCMALFTFGLASSVVATILIFQDSAETTSTAWVTTHLGIVLCGDLLLTGSILFWLLRHRETVICRSATAIMLLCLLRLTVQSAAPTTLCALLTFAVALQLHTSDTWRPVPLAIYFIAIMALPLLYAWSAMWTLNSREDICLAAEKCPYTVELGTEASGKKPCSSNSDGESR
ncbi:hypothetical protein K438DRAFT_1939914 [Mycena galopus ATCC 62051]|nr:hypothetical protein K438DRAFT_1939914 [Mycena galopus ATCC 62051]